MILKYFDAREAVETGIALADGFSTQTPPHSPLDSIRPAPNRQAEQNREFLCRATPRLETLRLNTYKRAKLAHAFRWRLFENGIQREIIDSVTERLVLGLFLKQHSDTPSPRSIGPHAQHTNSPDAQRLFKRGNQCFERGAYADAIAAYEQSLELHPGNADTLHNLGAALSKRGRYQEAEEHFRRAIALAPNSPDAYSGLGTLLRWKGEFEESETSLRRALKLRPNHRAAACELGLTLVLRGKLREARSRLAKVLKIAPNHADALFGMGQIAKMEGRFEAAADTLRRVIKLNPNMTGAWAELVSLRRMTSADAAWVKRAEEMAASGIVVLEEATLRFAIGKYYDDVGQYMHAFQNYERANRLWKSVADDYDQDAHAHLVDDLIHVYSRERIARESLNASDSTQPVFVVGMMRSGTSLIEQIIASHPAVSGAGELGFWSHAVRAHEVRIREGLLDETWRKTLADAYLKELADHSCGTRGHSTGIRHVTDKAPVNCNYLGIIHSIFPKARIIYLRRNPIDSCLSCYFQQLSPSQTFTMDLADLAHYYRAHHRLMAHWRAVLPPGTILDVPYAELVADLEGWTRKILDFVALEWDERCLEFDKTTRPVVTASSWQVRQKIYQHSVERWRNYEKHIAPLLSLRDLDRSLP